MLLSDIIIKRIQEEGPISFHDFMEMVLYYPHKGYYTSEKNKIGMKGDFYTSSALTPAFGAMIGRQLEDMWNILGKSEFTVVEFGAGTGALCHDILDYLKGNKEFYDRVNYCIIEKSAAMQKMERKHLNEKVTWYSTILDIPEFTGCILSNELVDNFSVHNVVMEDKLMEVFVGYEKGFIELLKPAGKPLTNYFEELNIVLPKGFRTEINLEATKWIREIAMRLRKGYVITIDYGYTSAELYSERRSCGTLLSYNKHKVNGNIYNNIGEQDITAHVNFSALIHWGYKNGLHCCGMISLSDFLLSLGFKDYLKMILSSEVEQDLISTVKKESFLTHTLLIDMGFKFKVLIQGKGIGNEDLLGMKLANLYSHSV